MTDRHLPDPPPGPSERSNGHRTGSSRGRSAPLPRPAADRTAAATAHPRVAARVPALDRLTLQLGVVVAVVIATCSYAVSATSLYALGIQAGYSWWQAAAVPVVADGPAIYGMFRIISRSRRGARGAGYGWLLVIAGTMASIGGNVAHAQQDLVARAIAAAIPLAVLAMLEGLKGDAGEVTRLAAQAAAGDGTGTLDPAGQLPQATTVRRGDPATRQHHGTGTFSPGRRALPAGLAEPTRNGTVGARLQAAYAQPQPDGQPWTARTLAEAAGCGRSSAASFLQRHRPSTVEDAR
jgi:hypothetical protein